MSNALLQARIAGMEESARLACRWCESNDPLIEPFPGGFFHTWNGGIGLTNRCASTQIHRRIAELRAGVRHDDD